MGLECPNNLSCCTASCHMMSHLVVWPEPLSRMVISCQEEDLQDDKPHCASTLPVYACTVFANISYIKMIHMARPMCIVGRGYRKTWKLEGKVHRDHIYNSLLQTGNLHPIALHHIICFPLYQYHITFVALNWWRNSKTRCDCIRPW